MRRTLTLTLCLMTSALAVPSRTAPAQPPTERTGEVVPRDVREMYDRGLKYLAATQGPAGDWPNAGQGGAGVTGLAMLAFLASGEDPNFGLYASPVRRALRAIVKAQGAETGIIGNGMYDHGFGMLALAEAYGAVDERDLWPDAKGSGQRSLGQALELAVRAAVTSQKKNPLGAWRYSPNARDADTSVSGAVLVGLLAARNAGIEVPDEAIDRALSYFQKMTSATGQVAGIGGFDESLGRVSIAQLVYSVGRRKDFPQHKATLEYLKQRLETPAQFYQEYVRYYEAQALFQGDLKSWETWNKLLIRQLKQAQAADGSIPGQFGPTLGTSMSLLALALNYRFLPIYER